MPDVAPPRRSGEYATRGDYHATPDPTWDYYPTYLAKVERVRSYLDGLAPGTRVLDAGCGEGVFVEAYASRLAIEGVDENYSSERVRRGSLLALPFEAGAFDRVLCLDVLEHLAFDEQPVALAEIYRVLTLGGEAFISIPNLAHLQSRVHFLLKGQLIRTASELKHPGDRPIAEFLRLFRAAGFEVAERKGIFPTIPMVTHLIRRHPAALMPLHRWLTRLVPLPGWCLLNLLRLRKAGRG